MLDLKERGAWFGDPEFKAEIVEKMHEHREKDRFIHGSYREFKDDAAPDLESFKGCAIGCLITSKVGVQIPQRFQRTWLGYHQMVEAEFNIPATVAVYIDNLFEATYTFEEGARFAVDSVETIAVGANLNELVAQLEHQSWHRGRFNAGLGTEVEFMSCEDCIHSDKLRTEHEVFLKELSNAPLMPAARALILAG